MDWRNECEDRIAMRHVHESELDIFHSRVIRLTMGISKTRSIYISNHDTNWEPSHLMRTLHENYIQTTIDNGTLQIQRREKVILLRLPDCSNILRLILGSVTNLDLTSNFSLRQSVATHEFSIPKICVEFRKRHLRQSPFQECDHLVEIDETELMPGSEISQSLFDQTRRLFHHPLWNAEKNIIFTIRRKVINVPWGFKTVSYDHRVELLFTFKFIWRFFRGRRVVVCVDQECYSYNPNIDDIIVYNADNKTYFDSTLTGRRISRVIYWRPTLYDPFYDFKHWTMMAPFLLEIVCHRLRGLSCEADPLIRDVEGNVASGRIDLTEAIKADADVVIVEGSVNDDDLRDYDVIPILDDGQLCFIVPEKGEMPSYLLPARCFSVTAWLFICITVASAIIVHELHRRMCVDLLSSEDDPHAAEFISTVFTVYSYVLCVSQSRLLDVFATGKILFVVITFGFFILTTAFLGIFVDYLSKRLRYEPLNTIEEVKESELLFQFSEAFSRDYFSNDAEYGWIKNKTIDSFDWYFQQKYAFRPYWEMNWTDAEHMQVGSWLGYNLSSMAMQSMRDAEIHALYNDGYIGILPRWALARKNDLFSVYTPMHDPFDLHIVKECIMNYPYDVLLLSNSVYRSEILSIIAHLKEAGIVLNKLQQAIDSSDYNFRSYDDDYESEPARAFSMFDLRIAFIALIVGLCFSSFVFIAELLYSDKAFPSFTTILSNLSDFCRLWN